MPEEVEPERSPQVEGERRRITALFADVVGSTSLAESMDPEDWAVLMNRLFGAMAEAVERYEGTVTQFGGDAVVAVFGAPRAHEDDPWRAVQAGLDMMAEIEHLAPRLDEPVKIRVGINTGLAVAGAVGTGAHTEYTAMGDPMNVAARVQAAAEPGSVLITADTYRLIGSDVDVRDAGHLELKGKSAPTRAYEVIGSRRAPTRTRGVPGLHSPMVGRADELATLESLADIAAAGRGRVAVILGEPGIGKSRLLRELKSTLSRDGSVGWAVGRCLSYGREMPYHLLSSLVGSLLDVPDHDDPEAVAKAVEERAEDLLDSEASVASDLAELAGSVDNRRHGDIERRNAYQQAVSALIRARAADHDPLVVVCEDIHWADPSSAEVLGDLLRGDEAGVLLILTSRLDRTSAGWEAIQAARQHFGEALTELSLNPLQQDHARELVSHLLEVEALPDDLRALVLDKAEGNPFFVEEVVRMLIECGAIEQHGNRWTATQRMQTVDVPDSVEALIASRVDRLPDSARQIARVASVIGRRFAGELLEKLLADQGEDAASVHSALGELEAHGLIRLAGTRPQLEYSFRHALVQEVVYSSLLHRERRELHRQVGEALERGHPDNLGELAAILGHHFDEAGDPRAGGYLLEAGRRALARFANREAFSFFERATRCLGEDADDEARRDRVEAALGRDRAGLTFVPYGQHLTILGEALPDAEALDDPVLLVKVHLALVRSRLEGGESYETSAELRSSLDEAFRLAATLDDPELRALPAAHMGDVRFYHGDPEGALELWSEAIPALEEAAMWVEAAQYASMSSRAHSILGRFGEAERSLARARDFAERSGDPNSVLDVDIFEAWMEADRGDLARAQEFTTRAIAAADEHGNLACSLLGNLLAGSQQLRLGDPDSAINHLERGSEMAAYCEVGSDLLALGRAWLADARTRLGTPSLHEFDDALAAAREVRNPLNEGQILRQQATVRLLLPEPDWDAAMAEFEAAEALFDKIGARAYLAPTLRDHAAALDLAGEPEEAKARLDNAEQLFSEMGIDPTT